MFLGYPTHSHGYRVLILKTNKIVETCKVSFDEASPGTRPDIAGILSQVQGRMVVFLKMRATTRSARPVRPGARPVIPPAHLRSNRRRMCGLTDQGRRLRVLLILFGMVLQILQI